MAQGTGLASEPSISEISILLVDDDIELGDLMRDFFGRRSIRIEAVHDGRKGLARAISGGHDLVLLDVMIPGLDGFEVLKLLRKQSQVPVIMLTARTAQADRVTGLNAGADDYLPKPFGPEELLARIRAVLRRTGRAASQPVNDLIELGPLLIRTSRREMLCEGVLVELTTIEYDLVEFLARASGRIVSRDELSSALYRRPASPFNRAMDVHVSHIRKKLGVHGSLVKTIRGSGYLLCSTTETETDRGT